MAEIVEMIQTLGFPIALVVALIWFIKDIINRDKDESKAREDKLIEANKESSSALSKVADTMDASNKLYSELSETNRLLVDKIEGELSNIDNKLEKVLDKLE